MCTSKPHYEAPVTEEAPKPEKAPDQVKSPDTVNSKKKQIKVKATGTSALRTDLGVPRKIHASGLSIPRR